MSQELRVADDRLGDEPKGYRDLYWCFSLNEPVILEYRSYHDGERGRQLLDAVALPPNLLVKRGAFCINCNWLCDGVELDAAFLSWHRFIGHVRKPKPSQGEA